MMVGGGDDSKKDDYIMMRWNADKEDFLIHF